MLSLIVILTNMVVECTTFENSNFFSIDATSVVSSCEDNKEPYSKNSTKKKSYSCM